MRERDRQRENDKMERKRERECALERRERARKEKDRQRIGEREGGQLQGRTSIKTFFKEFLFYFYMFSVEGFFFLPVCRTCLGYSSSRMTLSTPSLLLSLDTATLSYPPLSSHNLSPHLALPTYLSIYQSIYLYQPLSTFVSLYRSQSLPSSSLFLPASLYLPPLLPDLPTSLPAGLLA